ETISSEFMNPGPIVGDSQYLYVADRDHITRISKASGAPVPFSRDLSVAGFQYISSMWTDGNTMYVMDDLNNVLRRIDLAQLEFTVTKPATMSGPGTKPLWSDGRFLYIGITDQIGRIDLVTGEALMVTGLPGGGFVDGPAGVALVMNAQGAWADSQY